MRTNQRKIVLVICEVLLVSLTSGVARSEANPSVVGARRYVQYCAGCHGVDGKGADKASVLAANPDVMNRSDIELFRIVHDGTPNGMPPFAQIGDANIAAVVHFLRSLQVQPPGTRLPVRLCFLERQNAPLVT